MKTIIDKMVKLAYDYAELLEEKNFEKEKHFEFKYGDGYDDKVIVYLTREKQFFIKFEKVEIIELTGTVAFPFNYDIEDLKHVYEAAERTFDILKVFSHNIKNKK